MGVTMTRWEGPTFNGAKVITGSLELDGFLNIDNVPGSEKATTGDFASATGWTLGSGWAVASGVATHTGGGGTAVLEQDVSAVANELYKVVFTTSGRTAGTVTVGVGGATGTARSGNTTYTEYLKATGTGNLQFTPSTDFDGSLDDVSVKRVGITAADRVSYWTDDQAATAGKGAVFLYTEDGTGYVFGPQLSPLVNDGASLGSATVSWADAFFASGAVINFNNGDVTITHSANTLTIGGMDTRLDIAAGILELNNAVEWDTGVAIVATEYSIGRDADATNQLHFNVPTGATFEWSVNDAVEMTLSATAVNFQNNSLTTTGGGSLTGTWTDLGSVTTVDINGGTLDGVTIGGASAAAASVTTLTTTGSASLAAAVHYINESANAQMTTGLTINQGAADDEILAFKSSDVAHGVTTVTETDTFVFIKKISNTGGATLYAMGSDTDAQAINILGLAAATNATRSTAAVGTIQIQAQLRNGTGAQSIGADKNILVVSDNGTVRFILDSDGDSHQDVGTAWTNFDDHDDVALLNLLSAHVTRYDDPLRQQFGRWLEQDRTPLQAAKIASFNDDGHHFVNMSRLTMLHTGAIRQLNTKLQAEISTLKERLAQAEQRLAALPAA